MLGIGHSLKRVLIEYQSFFLEWSCRNLEQLASYRFLFRDERSVKNRPGIKACVIGPPETPSISIFLDWHVVQ